MLGTPDIYYMSNSITITKSNIFVVHVEDSRQAMCDDVPKYQDKSQVFVRQKPEEIYNEKGELFLTI